MEMTKAVVVKTDELVSGKGLGGVVWRERQTWASWWGQPCGGREVVRLAWPLVLSTASWTLMHFLDRVFLVSYSTDAFAAALPAGMLHFTMLCCPMGIAGYVNTFVSQYHGANRPSGVARVVWQGFLLGLASIPLFLATWPLAPALFRMVGHEPGIAREEIEYFRVLAFGGGAAVMATALASFFTGLGHTRVVLLVDLFAALFHIGVNYLLIFGKAGFPEWGIFGAGLSTVLCQWLKVACYLLVLRIDEFQRPYQFWSGFRFDWPLMRRLLRYGGPSGVQQLLGNISFTLFLFLLGSLGATELAATNVAFSVNSLAFVPLLGMGIAVSTLVGQQLGADRPDYAERATWTALALALGYTGFMALLYLGLPDLMLAAHAAGAGDSFESLRATSGVLLRFIALYCLFDATHIVFVSALKGAGDTRFVLRATLLIAPLPAVLSWFGLHLWGWRLFSFWVLLTAWICTLGVVYWARFVWGPWRRMRVIETEPAELDLDEPRSPAGGMAADE